MLLAQLLGLYFVIIGVIVLLRGRSLVPGISQLIANRPMIIILGLSELLAGLAIILTYPTFTWDWRGIIAVIGWMLVIEGIIYLAAPYVKIHKVMRSFNSPRWYQFGSLVAIVAGGYLLAVGFGFIQ